MLRKLRLRQKNSFLMKKTCIRELWEDLPYSFPFFLEFFFNKVVPLVDLKEKGSGGSVCDWCFFFGGWGRGGGVLELVTRNKGRGSDILMCSRGCSGQRSHPNGDILIR